MSQKIIVIVIKVIRDQEKCYKLWKQFNNHIYHFSEDFVKSKRNNRNCIKSIISNDKVVISLLLIISNHDSFLHKIICHMLHQIIALTKPQLKIYSIACRRNVPYKKVLQRAFLSFNDYFNIFSRRLSFKI